MSEEVFPDWAEFKAAHAELQQRLLQPRFLTRDEDYEFGARVQAGLIANRDLGYFGDELNPSERSGYTRAVRLGAMARDCLVLANERFVHKAALSFATRTAVRAVVDKDDLVQEGMMAMMRAAEKYDPTAGYRFLTVGRTYVLTALNRYIDQNDNGFKIPVHEGELRRKLVVSREMFLEDNKRLPNEQELAHAVAVPLGRVARSKKRNAKVVPLDSGPARRFGTNREFTDAEGQPRLKSDPHEYLLSHLDTEQEAVTRIMDEDLYDRVMDECGLTEREMQVIEMRYGFVSVDGMPMTYEEIGKAFGLTRERARQIEVKAMAKIRATFDENQWVDLDERMTDAWLDEYAHKSEERAKDRAASRELLAKTRGWQDDLTVDGEAFEAAMMVGSIGKVYNLMGDLMDQFQKVAPAKNREKYSRMLLERTLVSATELVAYNHNFVLKQMLDDPVTFKKVDLKSEREMMEYETSYRYQTGMQSKERLAMARDRFVQVCGGYEQVGKILELLSDYSDVLGAGKFLMTMRQKRDADFYWRYRRV